MVPKDHEVKEEILEIREELLYQKNLRWVPEGVVQQILESEHRTKVAGHIGQDKTIEFVRSCPKCQQIKATRYQPYSLFSPLELAYAPLQSIPIDFITELPVSENCDQLWVIIDRFTKMVRFLLLR